MEETIKLGLKTTWSGNARMYLVKPRCLLADKGFVGSLCIAFHMAVNPVLGQRILAMRWLFNEYGSISERSRWLVSASGRLPNSAHWSFRIETKGDDPLPGIYVCPRLLHRTRV